MSFHASSPSSEKLHFDWLALSKAYKFLNEIAQRSYYSHEAEERSKEKLVLEKYAIFV